MTDEQITEAVMACAAGPYPGNDYDYLIALDGVKHKIMRDTTQFGPFTATWVWEQREGKPWQAALEELVKRYWECQTHAAGL